MTTLWGEGIGPTYSFPDPPKRDVGNPVPLIEELDQVSPYFIRNFPSNFGEFVQTVIKLTSKESINLRILKFTYSLFLRRLANQNPTLTRTPQLNIGL